MHGVLESSESAIGSDGLGLAIGAGAPKRSVASRRGRKAGKRRGLGCLAGGAGGSLQMALDESPVTKDSVHGAL
jgi:hypothetical protein